MATQPQTQTRTPPRGAADRLVLAGRFAALVYLNFLVWLSLWVLVPMLALGWTPLAVDSGSMGPVIRPGDVVLIAPQRGGAVPVGRIITYNDPADPARLVTHRVTGVNDDGAYRTKGDANLDEDSTPLPLENIRGVARLIVPRVGLPVIWLQQQRYPLVAGWVLSVLLALTLLAPGKPSTQPAAAPAPRVPPRALRAPRTPRPRRRLAAVLPLPPPRRLAAPAPALPAPPPAAPATVPPVRYRLRLPPAPAALILPAPPRWTVSLVPPAPGTAPVAPIPAPPRAAIVRRAATGPRQVPSWSARPHGPR